MKGTSFLKLLDFTPAEIEGLLTLSADLKARKKAGIPHRLCEGKSIALVLAFLMILSAVPFATAFTAEEKGAPSAYATEAALYVHAVSNSVDSEAWQAWQSVHDEDFNAANPNEKYFFLPSSAAENTIDVYNGFDDAVTLNGVSIASHTTESVAYTANTAYTVTADGSSFTLKIMNSNAEGAIYINNPDADDNGTDLMTYLNQSKANSASATGAIVTPDGKINNTAVFFFFYIFCIFISIFLFHKQIVLVYRTVLP